MLQFSNASVAHKFAGQPEIFVTSLLTACLQDAAGVANGGHETLSLFNGECQWLFAVDVFLRPQRGQ